MDRALFRRGISLFNSGAFFEAHEVLEDVWRECVSEEKKALQGLVQLAVAFHHHSTGNNVGACSLLEKAERNLSGSGRAIEAIDMTRLLETISEWRRALQDGTAPPPFPQLDMPDAKIAVP